MSFTEDADRLGLGSAVDLSPLADRLVGGREPTYRVGEVVSVDSSVMPMSVTVEMAASGSIVATSLANVHCGVGDVVVLLRNGPAWLVVGLLSQVATATYTPAWTVNTGTAPALGNGTLQGRYQRLGKWLLLWIGLQLGSTTTKGGTNPNEWSFSLPPGLTARAAPGGTSMGQYGPGSARDTGVASYKGTGEIGSSGTTVSLLVRTNQGSDDIPAGRETPFAWGTGDKLQIGPMWIELA